MAGLGPTTDVAGAIHDAADLGEERSQTWAPIRLSRSGFAERKQAPSATCIARVRRTSCASGTVKSSAEAGRVGAGRGRRRIRTATASCYSPASLSSRDGGDGARFQGLEMGMS